jgi:Ca2+/H+ antiporter, TMEM165/GDT1 family
MKKMIRKKPYLIPLFLMLGAAAFALFGWLLMTLWNLALVPAVGANLISFWQALGILVLSRLLLGGMGGRRKWGYRMAMREKWMNMSEEDKLKFREQCRNRWGHRYAPANAQESQG